VRILFAVKDLASTDMLGIMYLSSMVKKDGHEIDVVDLEYNKVREKIKEYKPAIIGYSIATHNRNQYLPINKRIKKEFDIFSVFGGPHPTYFPDVIEEDGVDAICIGEGEYAFSEFINTFESGKDITTIENWWVKQNGKIHKNPIRYLIENLDTLPFPDRELFNIPGRDRQNTQSFIASRGCAFACTFCFNESLNKLYHHKGRVVRVRSVAHLIAEVKDAVKRYPIDFINFLDNVFIWTEKWGEEFAEKYAKEIGIPFFCCVQPRHLTEKMVVALKKANCRTVGMGVEAADKYILMETLNKRVDKEKILEVSKTIKKYGIRLNTYNMLGLPGSSLDKELETLKLNIAIRADYAGSTIYDPIPGTELAKKAKDIGLLNGSDELDMDGTHSVLKFNSKADKIRRENLTRLFPITAELPFLLPLIRLLIRLPLTGFYTYIYRLWEGYCTYFRLFPRRMSWNAFFRNIYYHIHHDRG